NNDKYTDAVFPYSAPRVGIVWRPNTNVALRLAGGGGLALPGVGDLDGATNAPDCSNGIYCTQNVNNISLRPETSFAWDLGTDVRTPNQTVVSLDLYRTNLYGQFYSQTAIDPNCGAPCGGLPLFITERENLVPSRYEGVQFHAARNVGKGLFWDGGLGLTRSFVVSLP